MGVAARFMPSIGE